MAVGAALTEQPAAGFNGGGIDLAGTGRLHGTAAAIRLEPDPAYEYVE